MLELFIEILLYSIPQTTGKALVYVLTFGQVRCEDGLAEIIGVVFWLFVLVVVMVVFARA